MASLNQVHLIGNVGGNPDVRYIGEGTQNKVAQFSLATQEGYKDRNGQWQEQTEWHRIVVFSKLADIAEKYIRKGSQLYVEGRLRTRSWNDQTGAKKSVTEIVANNIQLIGPRPADPAIAGARQLAEQQQSRTQQPERVPLYQQAAQMQAAPVIEPGAYDDDLPF